MNKNGADPWTIEQEGVDVGLSLGLTVASGSFNPAHLGCLADSAMYSSKFQKQVKEWTANPLTFD